MECYLPLVIPKNILSDEGSGAEYGIGLEKSNTEIPTSEVDRSQHYQDKKKHLYFYYELFHP